MSNIGLTESVCELGIKKLVFFARFTVTVSSVMDGLSLMEISMFLMLDSSGESMLASCGDSWSWYARMLVILYSLDPYSKRVHKKS